MSGYRIRATCRLCDADRLEHVLTLASTPPANEFVHPDAPRQDEIPLYLARCTACGHVQLPVVVDPARLFRNYVYVSGTAPSFVEHFRRYAEACVECFDMKAGDLVVEIGSNDGTLLRAFQALNMTAVGVDPAEKIAAEATARGTPTIPAFFTREVAQQIRHAHHQPALLVVANNVFAHADNLRDIALGVRDLLDPQRGRFVFEVQYLVDLVEKTLFDMVYHEHLSYHTLGPLVRFFDSVGMSLVDALHVDTHGGSIRCTAAVGRGAAQSMRLQALLTSEAARYAQAVDPWGDLRRRIDDAGAELRSFLDGERAAGRSVSGYGAPAKLTTLCHQFGIGRGDIAFVVDDSPWKQGLLTPGKLIPILPPCPNAEVKALGGVPQAQTAWTDSIVVFAWNFAEPIARKLRAAGFTGKIVTPLPTFKELP